jgi:PAS domain-containing protein
MTGLDDEGSITRAYQAGVTDFITKLINEMVLRQQAIYILHASRTVCEFLEGQFRVQAQAALLDITQDAMIVSDLEGRIMFWNPGAERLHEWTANDALGITCVQTRFRPCENFEPVS